MAVKSIYSIDSLNRSRIAAIQESRKVTIAIYVTLSLGFFLVFLIYLPLLLLGLLSFSGDPLSGIPGDFTLTWFQQLFAKPDWWPPLALTLKVALAVAAMCTIGALLVGRILPRLGRGSKWLMLLFLLPLVVPGMVLGVQEFTFYRTFLGLRTGVWSMLITHFIWAFPFALLGMLVVTLKFDSSLLEAAADLGASPWQQFRDIEWPLLMPGTVTAALFGFMLSMTELPRTLFTRGDAMTLPVYVWAESSARVSHIPLIYCLNTLITIVSVVLSICVVLMLSRMGQKKTVSLEAAG